MSDIHINLKEYRVVEVSFLIFCCYIADILATNFMAVSVPLDSQSGFATGGILALVGVGKYWMSTSADKHPTKSCDHKILATIRQFRIVSVIFLIFCSHLAYIILTWFWTLDIPVNNQGVFATSSFATLVGIGKYFSETKAVVQETE